MVSREGTLTQKRELVPVVMDVSAGRQEEEKDLTWRNPDELENKASARRSSHLPNVDLLGSVKVSVPLLQVFYPNLVKAPDRE